MGTRLGILSDSHGHADITSAAMRLLKEQGATVFVHLGDIGNEEVINELVGVDAHVVFGNCDWDIEDLSRYARSVDIAVDHPMGEIEVEGKRIAFTHGHLEDLMASALEQGADYLLHGHTHELRDERVGPTRIINPGALFRASRYTAAVLDPAADRLDIIEIPHRSLKYA